MRGLLYSYSPGFACALYRRIEASPLANRLVKVAFWSMVGTLGSRILGMLSTVLVGRMLGKHEFGELGIIQSTISTFGTLAGFSMGITANKYVSTFKRTDPARAGRTIALASAIAWITSSLIALVLVVSAPWLAAKTLAAPHLAGLLQVSSLLLILTGVTGAQTGALMGFEAFKRLANINLTCGLLTFPLMVVGTWHWGVTGAVWGLIGTQAANCLLAFFALRTEASRYQIKLRFAGCFSDLGLFWRFSLPTVLSGLLCSLVAWVAGALVVNQAGGYGDMGIYNAALRMKMVPEMVVGMLLAPMMPTLCEAFSKGDRVTIRRTALVNFILAPLIVVPVALIQLAVPALTVLPFGADYKGHPAVVTWLMLSSVMFAIAYPVGPIIISMGKMWFSGTINLLASLLLAVTSWWLVPHHGAAGYAAAMVVTAVVGNIPYAVFFYRHLPDVMRVVCWQKFLPGLAALCAGAVVASWMLTPAWAGLVGIATVVCFLGLNYHLYKRVWRDS